MAYFFEKRCFLFRAIMWFVTHPLFVEAPWDSFWARLMFYRERRFALMGAALFFSMAIWPSLWSVSQ